jgi:hypothetical protein
MTVTLQDPPIGAPAPDPLPATLIKLGELNDDQGERRLIASRDLDGALLAIDEDRRGNYDHTVSSGDATVSHRGPDPLLHEVPVRPRLPVA